MRKSVNIIISSIRHASEQECFLLYDGSKTWINLGMLCRLVKFANVFWEIHVGNHFTEIQLTIDSRNAINDKYSEVLI